jgi:hypothetical protein
VIRRACGLTRPLIVAASLVATAHPAHANGAHGATLTVEPPTRFERFVLVGCSPCVKETYPIAAIAAPPLKLAAFPRAVTMILDNPSVRVTVVTFAPGSGTGRHQGIEAEVGILVEAEVTLDRGQSSGADVRDLLKRCD